nr:MAG TPA: hypothetical protein [Caudoviricetes sp.]
MEIITKHCRKLIMDLFLKYPAWAFCFRWSLVLLLLCFSISLIE